MDRKIVPDDLDDQLELIQELRDWINKRKDKMNPWQAVSLLTAEGSRIAYLHAVDLDDIPEVLEDAQEIGRLMAYEYLKIMEDEDE